MINGSRKSLDLYREIWINLANNQRYSPYVTCADLSVFSRRSEKEGLTFLTQTLPNLGKAIDFIHSSGKWRDPLPMNGYVTPNFRSDVNGIPLFLGVAFDQALKGDSLAVDCIRQLSYMFYKLEVPFDQQTVSDFLDNFEKVDIEVGALYLESQQCESLIAGARGLISRILYNCDPLDIRPRHGSGATACRTANQDKYHLLRYYPKLDACFSYADYFFYNFTHLVDEFQKLVEAVEQNPMARICLVPKDSRGPRVISCEPAELMFIQQGLMRKLYETIEGHYLTKGQINFIDQGVNRKLAYQGSISGEYATIDLTDASDRVSLALVRRLFPNEWVEAFEACRSERTELPNGRVVELHKFAPMGSSCCFPVEAMVFWAIASASIHAQRSNENNSEVYVYGDDIIVRTLWASTVMDALEAVGLKVNRPKCFTSGPFRESCGGDYHNGYDVTPVRIKKPIGMSRTDIATDADLANSFIAKFGIRDSQGVIDLINDAQVIPFPKSPMPQPCCILGDLSASNDVFYRRRYNKDLQRMEYRIRRVSSRAYARREPSWCELLRKELTRGIDGDVPEKYENFLRNLEAVLDPGWYVDPHSTKEKWEWVWLG